MKEKIIEILQQIKPELEVFENTHYISDGTLDSFDIIALCDAFNKNFEINIDGSDIIPENFESVDNMLVMIEKNRKKK